MFVSKIAFKANSTTNLLSQYSPRTIQTLPISQTPQTQNFETTNTETPVAQASKSIETKPKHEPHKKENKAIYISYALTAAAISLSGIIALKHGKLVKKYTKDAELSKSIIQELRNIIDKNEKIKESEINELDGRITGLGKWQDGQISGVKEELLNKIDSVNANIRAANASDLILKPVNINGNTYELAGVMHGYGKNTQALEQALQSESTKRIFGLIDRSSIVPKDDIMIRVPTAEFSGFTSTGGMSIVPKEIISNLAGLVNTKQKIRIVADTPLYLGQVEDNVFYSIVKNKNGKYDYISSRGNKVMAELEKLDSKLIPIYTDKGKSSEYLEVYMARNLEQEIDLNLLKERLNKDFLSVIEDKLKLNEPFENEFMKLTYNTVEVTDKNDPYKIILQNKPTVKIKYDAVFYKNDKFKMDGPVTNSTAKTIYNNLTHEAGETERFIYFDKYFYEYLLHGAETSNENLRADLIIGNDWHTGGISAMLRLLTLAKKAFGLDPKIADKIYNTPNITILHNAQLSGCVSHSQAKLLNILFGEHAAVIAQNAYMPKAANLPSEMLNGLFNGASINPQTMACAYSDSIIPVSKGYGNELANHSGFGQYNHHIYRMRGRYHEFSNMDYLRSIAAENKIDPKLVTENNIAYRPIVNGCDKVNNTLKETEKIEKAVGLNRGSLRVYQPEYDILEWHNHNKEVYLNKVIQEVKLAAEGKSNVMNIELPEMTNLDGVTKDTMVVTNAGRIADQKGLDIFAEAIDEFISRHPNEDLPVFYIQGIGEQQFIDGLMNVKRRIAAKWGQKAANRIVFARLFNEPGRYDGCKLMSDFTSMTSWQEPCGLVHKQVANYSASIPIVNKVGGLTDGLEDGVNAIFANFRNKYDNYQDALNYNKHEYADALDRAYELFKNKEAFAKGLESSFKKDHSWLAKGGSIEEYAKIGVDLKVLKPEVLQ